ncbi:MAG: hypothetical protein BGO78_03505 [Chloroflexi bacterium 44-23]|nr:MAG: hypothetical protein BGO78_03505 [Chloroflexi bacterium 44-23]
MAHKKWKVAKQIYCDHAGCNVSLEYQVILPAEILPDQPARIIAHRCSKGMQCSQLTKPTCVWSGTNPNYDPFQA